MAYDDAAVRLAIAHVHRIGQNAEPFPSEEANKWGYGWSAACAVIEHELKELLSKT